MRPLDGRPTRRDTRTERARDARRDARRVLSLAPIHGPRAALATLPEPARANLAAAYAHDLPALPRSHAWAG